MRNDQDELVMYVVYEKPTDYPDFFVVRRWTGLSANKIIFSVSETLDDARQTLPRGLFRLDRFNTDDPCIVETWL